MVRIFGDIMGNQQTGGRSTRRKSLRSFRNPGRGSSKSRNLSHTFTVHDDQQSVELININTATEEELMTLTGIRRDTARGIVEHRKVIGRFRKVEDLALVSGMGAAKLEKIRPEICVNNTKKLQNGYASRAQSYDSLRSTDSKATIRSNKLINVNTASVFELQCVHGISQEIAAAVVHYREKRGAFKQVDDLRKVKCIDSLLFNNISRRLTTNTDDQNYETPASTRPCSVAITNGFTNLNLNGNNHLPLRFSLSNGLSPNTVEDIFELLSTYSPRPLTEDVFKCSRNGRPAIRIANWNLHEFSFEKANNPGVREVICRTILENGWSIIAVQEILDASAIKLICDELNKPNLRRIKECTNNKQHWNFCMLEVPNSQLGFIYNADCFNIEMTNLHEGPSDIKAFCDLLVVNFNIGELEINLVNMKLKKRANFDELNHILKEYLLEENLMLLLGDFSTNFEKSDSWLTIGNLKPIFPTNTSTLCVKSDQRPHVSNILHNSNMGRQLTKNTGVVREGLTHLAIPNGWNWGGPVSPYCPIWVELFVNENLSTTM